MEGLRPVTGRPEAVPGLKGHAVRSLHRHDPQERDLDRLILEELCSDKQFDRWFGEQTGLKGFRCREAVHSGFCKSAGSLKTDQD